MQVLPLQHAINKHTTSMHHHLNWQPVTPDATAAKHSCHVLTAACITL